METVKKCFATAGFKFLPSLAFCLLIEVPQQIAWLYEGHSVIELREMTATEPFSSKAKKLYRS